MRRAKLLTAVLLTQSASCPSSQINIRMRWGVFRSRVTMVLLSLAFAWGISCSNVTWDTL